MIDYHKTTGKSAENLVYESFSPGKLMISGEYAVLEGALALAVPLGFGQELSVWSGGSPREMIWISKIRGKEWFSAIYDPVDLRIRKTTDQEKAKEIQAFFLVIKELKNDLDQQLKGRLLISHLQFDPQWGWGSSSTLFNNLAGWLDIDPFVLNHKVNGGSGCDIAVAQRKHSLFFHLEDGQAMISDVSFDPVFKHLIFFVYHGWKQPTKEHLRAAGAGGKMGKDEVDKITELTKMIAGAGDQDLFMTALNMHEKIISYVLGFPRIRQELFPDFRGAVKSLGAWGGDFFMAIAGDAGYLQQYFKDKGYAVMFNYEELIASNLSGYDER